MNEEMAAAVARELLEESRPSGGVERFRYEGSSMHPALVRGDVLTIDPARRPSPGDIIVFRCGGSFVAHRYLLPWRAEGRWARLAKADNRLRFDSPVTPDRLVGRVIAVTGSDGGDPYASGRVHGFRALLVAILSLSEGLAYEALRVTNRGLGIYAGPRVREAAGRLVSLPRALYRRLSGRRRVR